MEKMQEATNFIIKKTVKSGLFHTSEVLVVPIGSLKD